MKPGLWERIGNYLDRTISPGQEAALGNYLNWLSDEAIPAGGLGPDESGRLETRHLGDSLLFYSGWSRPEAPPRLWDLGAGVGLPGIPLAILLPETEVTLVDRSGRRVDLARRAVRVLDLGNVTVKQADIENLRGKTPMLVSRATKSPERLRPLIKKHLEPGGVAVVGGSWIERPDTPGWAVQEIPPDLLDRAIWLLIMRR